MSERMGDSRVVALVERLRIVARGESSLLESSAEAIIEDWRRARAAEARLLEENEHMRGRAKDLEAVLEDAMGTFLGIYNSCVVSLDGPGPHALSNSIRPRAKAAACKLGEALHPTPPASASDRAGTR